MQSLFYYTSLLLFIPFGIFKCDSKITTKLFTVWLLIILNPYNHFVIISLPTYGYAFQLFMLCKFISIRFSISLKIDILRGWIIFFSIGQGMPLVADGMGIWWFSGQNLYRFISANWTILKGITVGLTKFFQDLW